MHSIFTARSPAVLGRTGLLEVCNKLSVAIDDAARASNDIQGVYVLRTYACTPEGGSSHLYYPSFGFPLVLRSSFYDYRGKAVGGFVDFCFYWRKDEQIAMVTGDVPDAESPGDIDHMVRSVVTAIFSALKSQLSES